MEAWAYDHTGNNVTRQQIAIGDEADWKRRGMRGSYRVRVVNIDGKRIKVQFLKYSDNPRYDFSNVPPRWVKPSFIRIYPNTWRCACGAPAIIEIKGQRYCQECDGEAMYDAHSY